MQMLMDIMDKRRAYAEHDGERFLKPAHRYANIAN